MAEWQPVTVEDEFGDEIEIDVSESGWVSLLMPSNTRDMAFGPERYEEFSRVWNAAGHESDRRRSLLPICGELSPGRGAACTQTGAHGEHIARAPGGIITARWPVAEHGGASHG